MRSDTIFRIYSMTKPIVSVAAMLLVEDGALLLNDPVSKWLPPFKDVKVLTAGARSRPSTPMTVQDLLRHTPGLPYGELTQNATIKDALAKAGLFKPGVIEFDARDMTPSRADRAVLQDSVALSARDGLGVQPIRRSSRPRHRGRFRQAPRRFPVGANLQAAQDERHGLLGVEADKARLAEAFEKNVLSGTPIKLIDVSKPLGNDSGEAGAVSTADAYLRFAQMLANGGVLDGQRIMSRTTLRLMTSDHLGSRLPLAPTPGATVLGASTYTFGLRFAVRPSDVSLPSRAQPRFQLGGYAGTFFWVTRRSNCSHPHGAVAGLAPVPSLLFRQLVYQAITD